ncbi:Plasmodium exported protein, unknown function, partial [Plasmodium vivax]
YNHGTYIEKLYNVEITSNLIYQRSLARYVPKKELDRSNTRAKLLENNSYSNVKCTSDDLSKYSALKKKGLNNLYLYKKLYNHRYAKKNSLGKFDCYCEKKIFDKFDHIHNLAEKLQNDKKTFKKQVNKIFLLRLIIFGLVPLLGLIIPLLKSDEFGIITWCFSDCKERNHYKDNNFSKEHEKYNMLSIDKVSWKLISFVNFIFWTTTGVFILCMVLYILLKMIKYKKLKAGKDKMSLKEYYHF